MKVRKSKEDNTMKALIERGYAERVSQPKLEKDQVLFFPHRSVYHLLK